MGKARMKIDDCEMKIDDVIWRGGSCTANLQPQRCYMAFQPTSTSIGSPQRGDSDAVVSEVEWGGEKALKK
ncbi:unnamed protein product [Rhodiola kirilowii]